MSFKKIKRMLSPYKKRRSAHLNKGANLHIQIAYIFFFALIANANPLYTF